MTEVKVLAAREQRKLGELMAELVRAGLESHTRPAGQAGQASGAEQWLVEWLKLADEIMQGAPASPEDHPTARALLEQERNRLERH